MQYGAQRTQFLNILNRSDCTDALAKTFFTMALGRIQREYRSPDIVKQLTIDTTLSVTTVAVPSDWVETQVFGVTSPNGDSRELVFKQLGSYQRKVNLNLGCAEFYTRQLSNWLVTGPIEAGATAWVTYWPTQPPLVNDTDETQLCITAPDVLIYAALTYAA